MDFSKYISFLDSKSLFFSRSDLLGDPYEGAMSRANIEMRPEVYKDVPRDVFGQLTKFAEGIRLWTFLNCWHMNEYESAAMWKLYTQNNDAVAIQSTYQRFCDSTPENVYIGTVNYIDYEKDWLPEGNSFWPFVHKRISFEHERELRGVIQECPLNDKRQIHVPPNPERGRLVNVDIEKLVEKVYVSPEANTWFAELIAKVTAKYSFKFEVNQSLLSKDPIF